MGPHRPIKFGPMGREIAADEHGHSTLVVPVLLFLSQAADHHGLLTTLPHGGVHARWPESKDWLLADAATCAATVLSATDGWFFPTGAFTSA
nr:unnamed protein product [Digitaria exilis]